MKNYTSKTAYLGMDVHKKTYAVTAICEGVVVKRDTLKADPDTLIAYCKKFFVGANIETAYEAGFCGFHLHRCLEAVGIKNIVVDAASIEISVGNKVKTDKRDSLKIAAHLSEGRLTSINIPTAEREDLRAVTRLRETWTRQRVRLGNQLKSLLMLNGLIKFNEKKKISLKWLRSLETLELSRGLRFSINHFLTMWRRYDIDIKAIDKELSEQAEKDDVLEKVYRSAPGIGPTSARILANELGDMVQFDNERRLSSYVGVTPSEHSSGEHVRQGHITRQGKPILRKVLVQAAWRAIKIDDSLGEIFDKLSQRVGKKKAIIGIARKLIGRIRACFRTGELYHFKAKKRKNDSEPLELLAVSA